MQIEKTINAVILARGGSKGVPRKNIRLLDGVPLILYPIIEARKSKYIKDIYVSTEDEEIKKIGRDAGCKIINRPKELCEDNSTEIESFRHYVNTTNDFSNIVHLRATTPLVNVNVIDDAIEYFNDNECTSLRSGHEISESIYKFFKLDGKYWSGFFPELEGEYYNLPRQTYPKNYLPNGYVDILKPEIFMNTNSLHGDKILSFITDFTPEVDSESDFQYLKMFYEQTKSNGI